MFKPTHKPRFKMKHFGLLLAAVLFGGWAGSPATAAPLQGRVKSVKIYPRGVYVTMSIPTTLRAGETEIAFPDLWYADPATVELRLLAGTTGATYVMESQQAVRGSDVEQQQRYLLLRDTLAARRARLEADSMVLVREIEFLQANAKQEATSVSQLAAVDTWMQAKYASVYEAQRKNRESRAALDRDWAENERAIRRIESQASQVTLVRARVNSLRTQKAEFELAYFTRAAQWEPVYFFRFEPARATAELDYQGTVWQWTHFDWDRVAATLSYGTPNRSLNRAQLTPQTLLYSPAIKYRARTLELDVTQDMAVDASKFGGTYTGEERPKFMASAPVAPMASTARMEVSENNISYQLASPLTLVSSSDNGNIRQTVQVRRDTVPVLYEYEVTPKISTDVLLLARVPGWQELHLTNGRVNVFCDGRMLGQSNLSVRNTADTLVLPLTLESQVVVERKETGNYQERVSGAKMERMRSYEIRVKNNKSFPVNLTVKDQYPLSSTSEVEIALTNDSGAEANPQTGMLIWHLDLAPGEERVVTFGYTVRYPRGGDLSW